MGIIKAAAAAKAINKAAVTNKAAATVIKTQPRIADSKLMISQSIFLKLKDLTDALEMKMQEYIATNQKKSALTNEDVISLILNMMNGMIDWTRDLIAQQSSQSQLQ